MVKFCAVLASVRDELQMASFKLHPPCTREKSVINSLGGKLIVLQMRNRSGGRKNQYLCCKSKYSPV